MGTVMETSDGGTDSSGELTRRVLDYELKVKDLVLHAKEPGYSQNVGALLADMIEVGEFERIGISREAMNWNEYLDFLIQWANRSNGFATRVRRVTEVARTLFSSRSKNDTEPARTSR